MDGQSKRWSIEQTKEGPRLVFESLGGAAYGARYEQNLGARGGNVRWLIITANDKELTVERADVDEGTETLDAAMEAILDAQQTAWAEDRADEEQAEAPYRWGGCE